MPAKRKLTGAAAAAVEAKKARLAAASKTNASAPGSSAPSATTTTTTTRPAPVSTPASGATTFPTPAHKSTKPPVATTKAPAAIPSPIPVPQQSTKVTPWFLPAQFSGKFDLFTTTFRPLSSAYLPEGATAPHFEDLVKGVLLRQAIPDISIRVTLPSDAMAPKSGIFACPSITNPMSDEEVEPIRILDCKTQDVSFGENEAVHGSTVGKGVGILAKLRLDTDNDCMMDSGLGTFKIRKVWEGKVRTEGSVSDQTVELFEGYWTIKVRDVLVQHLLVHVLRLPKLQYSSLLRRKGFGSGNAGEGAFWGVRALKD
ncbi:hypothetical protein BV25DRAFT_1295369 [Artomyces pyxidatus]|uniref:Uncharacterized protein n=1 Tax=Artomyces pyxidatus TaxID=48021 RepID=A0ACB8SQV8_9AGAM|nr:hypothetical protein BV25DRAFT_1295369 [Artomyces pyxidatus]